LNLPHSINASIVNTDSYDSIKTVRHFPLENVEHKKMWVQTSKGNHVKRDDLNMLTKNPPHASLESRNGPRPPFPSLRVPPLPWNPIAHPPMVPRTNSQPTPRRPCTVTMLGPDPPQYSRLVLRQAPI